MISMHGISTSFHGRIMGVRWFFAMLCMVEDYDKLALRGHSADVCITTLNG
jgi:hypothetical protein